MQKQKSSSVPARQRFDVAAGSAIAEGEARQTCQHGCGTMKKNFGPLLHHEACCSKNPDNKART